MSPTEFIYFADELNMLRHRAVNSGFMPRGTTLRQLVEQLHTMTASTGQLLDRYDARKNDDATSAQTSVGRFNHTRRN